MGIIDITPKISEPIIRRNLPEPKYDPELSIGSDISEVRHTGFYYDSQLSDPSMIMSLHPSTFNMGGSWMPFTKGYKSFNGGDIVYSRVPIAVCLLSEDPSSSMTIKSGDGKLFSMIKSTSILSSVL